MTDPNTTKLLLAASLKELMEVLPFDKINVIKICENCDVSRNSFYYHFKDKHDLVNWIFNSEFEEITNKAEFDFSPLDQWNFIDGACRSFYKNRSFYRRALMISGQNSFSDHLSEYLYPLLRKRITIILGVEAANDFAINFFTDASICAIKRWLLEKQIVPVEEFLTNIKELIKNFTIKS